MQIDFLYFDGCPHAAPARERLRDALSAMGAPVQWSEWDTGSASTPEPLRGYASPTILINGIDVERKAPTSGAGCAVGGGPSLDVLRTALAAVHQ